MKELLAQIEKLPTLAAARKVARAAIDRCIEFRFEAEDRKKSRRKARGKPAK